MTLPRRTFIAICGATLTAPLWLCDADALDYPNRLVRIIVGFPPGGQQDIVARLLAQWLTEHLGQQFVVENRSGAGGNIGAEAVVNSAPDGYTLLLLGSPNAINATLYTKLAFDIQRDISPVAGIARTPLVLEVTPTLPVKTVPELIAYAKANPGHLNFASAGVGTPQHVSGELFKMMTGINMVHVPYRGAAPALTDMLAGQVQVMIDPLPASIEYVRSGKLRPLAMTSTTRLDEFPHIPTVAEFVPGYESGSWYGIGVPAGTPAEIVTTLNRAINAAIADSTLKKRLADLGTLPLPSTRSEIRQFFAADIEKWAKVIKASGAGAE